MVVKNIRKWFSTLFSSLKSSEVEDNKYEGERDAITSDSIPEVKKELTDLDKKIFALEDCSKIWRIRWLDSLLELSDLKLQQRWLDKTNLNPHWSYIEFCCCYFDDLNLTEGYDYWLQENIVSP